MRKGVEGRFLNGVWILRGMSRWDWRGGGVIDLWSGGICRVVGEEVVEPVEWVMWLLDDGVAVIVFGGRFSSSSKVGVRMLYLPLI